MPIIIARVNFDPAGSEIVVRPICSPLISLKRGARALFLLGAGLYTNKIIIFVASQSDHDVFTTEFTYAKNSFWFFVVRVCKILRQLSAVESFGLLMKYRHSFATVISLNHFVVHHEISQAHGNKPRSKHKAKHKVKSRQIQCKHSYYGVKLSRPIKCKSWLSLKILCNVSGRSFVETSPARLPNVLAAI